jgi:hypothetical protein
MNRLSTLACNRAVGAKVVPSDFARLVNPYLNRLCAPHYYLNPPPPRIFRYSYGPIACNTAGKKHKGMEFPDQKLFSVRSSRVVKIVYAFQITNFPLKVIKLGGKSLSELCPAVCMLCSRALYYHHVTNFWEFPLTMTTI